MNYGIKIWSTNIDQIDEAIDLIKKGYYSYIEILVIPNSDIKPFIESIIPQSIPVVIHVAHEEFGTNICGTDKHTKIQSMSNITEAISWADQLNSKYIILHPGYNKGYGNIHEAKNFLTKLNMIFKDKKILIENMPQAGMNNETMVGSSPAEIIYLLKNTNFGFCLDFGHAIKTAIHNEVEYKPFVKAFMNLNPEMFHLTDGHLNNDKDEHLELGTGDFDLLYLTSLVICPPFCTQDINHAERFITIESPGWNKI